MDRTIFKNANLLDGESPARANQTLVIEGNRIVSANGAPAEDRPGDRIYDLAGRTLMPGMVTTHFHSSYRDANPYAPPLGYEGPPAYLTLVAAENCETALLSGFTSAVGASCAHDIDASLKQAIDEGMIPGPRLIPSSRDLISTGDSNDTARPWWWGLEHPDGLYGGIRICDGPDEFRKAVRDEIKRGAEMIKLYPTGGHGVTLPKDFVSIDHEELVAAVDAAHQRGARIRGHSVSKRSILECVRAGMDIIDHADEMDAECIEAFVTADCTVVPSVYLGLFILESSEQTGESLGFTEQLQREFEYTCGMLAEADAAGVRLVVGDDYGAAGFPHGDYAKELAVYVKHANMAPLDVLRWATKNGAALMGLGDELGTLAPGKLADLLVVDGDPSQDIGLLQDRSKLLAIMKDGRFAKNDLLAS